jgi:hypothetical protein
MARATSKRIDSLSTKIARQLRKLRKLHDDAFRPHHGKLDVIVYFEQVLRLKWTAKSTKKHRILRKKIRSESSVKARKGKGTIHTIIEATADSAPPRIRNRWVRALLFADKNSASVKQDGLLKFVKEHGGIAGCAAEMAKLRSPRQPKGLLASRRLLDSWMIEGISPQAKNACGCCRQ